MTMIETIYIPIALGALALLIIITLVAKKRK